MNVRELALPFRVGATSYVIADDLLPNARHLAAQVQDMQLVLFDVEGGPSNLPAPDAVAALAELGAAQDLTYTVHLLDDVRLGAGPHRQHRSLERARQVIELTAPLAPFAYVLHLDGRDVRSADTPVAALRQWQADSAIVLELLGAWVQDPARLAVENLEGYPPDFVTPVVVRTPASRCVDVGHLWLDGHDPLLHLGQSLPRTRVVHLHGLAPRDHQSLAHMDPAQLDPVIDLLLRSQFDGVVTLEVFGEDDFRSSLDALVASISRCRAKHGVNPWADVSP